MKDIHFWRIQYWWPWRVTDVWRPRIEKSCDEWHNKSYLVVIPFVGVVVWFFGPFNREGEEHVYGHGPDGYEGRIVDGCDICAEITDPGFWD